MIGYLGLLLRVPFIICIIEATSILIKHFPLRKLTGRKVFSICVVAMFIDEVLHLC